MNKGLMLQSNSQWNCGHNKIEENSNWERLIEQSVGRRIQSVAVFVSG
jgi:hypothetical protein